MNIFILDKNMEANVKAYANKHIVKMILETAQILSNAYPQDEAPYRRTHYNHPCCKWARESVENWKYLRMLGLTMYKEYQRRYNKNHKSGELIKSMVEPDLLSIGLTPFAIAVPEEYKTQDAIESYRNYYVKEKAYMWSEEQKQTYRELWNKEVA